MIPSASLRELEQACETAKDYTSAFNDAVKAQAEQYDLNPKALGRYVRARVADKLEQLRDEQDTVEQLQMAFDSPTPTGEPSGAPSGQAATH